MQDWTAQPDIQTATVIGSIRKAVNYLAVLLGTLIVLSLVAVVSLKWINPPTSSFMVQRHLEAWWNDESNFELKHDWINWDQISPYIKVAVITSEDQNFAEHWGFDMKAIREAIEEHQQGRRLRGASTISQQVAKNLFLWPGQSFIRKAAEAYLTLLIEWTWSKQRILEVYLNIAEFGNGVYGVKAASKTFFNTTPDQLDMSQSALMATALPSPRRYDLANPSPYMINQRNWILQYMFYLGNRDYLDLLQ